MPLDLASHGPVPFLASIIRECDTKRDKLSLGIDALILIAPKEWMPVLKALRAAREWEHDDEQAAFHWEEVARAAEVMAADCWYHHQNPGERDDAEADEDDA